MRFVMSPSGNRLLISFSTNLFISFFWRTNFHTPVHPYLCLSVGYHNGGLSLKDRNLIEGLFLKGDLQILCTTNTLAHGVNLPAHTVVIKSTQYLYVWSCTQSQSSVLWTFISTITVKIHLDLGNCSLYSNKEKGLYLEYERSMILQVRYFTCSILLRGVYIQK